MKTQLLKQIESLDIDRKALVDELRQFSMDTLARKPGENRWSILEIVEHMVLAERTILKNLPDSELTTEGSQSLKSRVLYPVIVFVLSRRIPVKVPSRSMLPKGESSLEELCGRWDENFNWLKSHLEGLGPGGHRQTIFSHPVVGPIDTAQAVKMARLHFDTHRRQIRTLLDSDA